jgi:hypothetical protein
MDLKTRISAFAELGTRLPAIMTGSLPEQAFQANNWFTKSEVDRALKAWTQLLTASNLFRWTDLYNIREGLSNKNVLVITAGNIPLVGFHDFVSVLITGNRFVGKLSSRDDILLTAIAGELIKIEPHFSELIHSGELSTSPDAVIATGSNNSSRYFQTEYGHIRHIIRKNRSSAAVVDGNETHEDLRNLACDILQYYGLGCRSVSHLFLPAGYSPENLVEPLNSYTETDPCASFSNNHRFQKARLSLLNIPFINTDPVLLVENESLHSPIGIVHYSYYTDKQNLLTELMPYKTEIQCLCGHKSGNTELLPYGTAQKPELWDYADQMDTMEFLINI